MIDISTFLPEHNESLRRAQAAARSGFVTPTDLVLPIALKVAIRHGFLLQPVLARSAFAPRSAYIGVPSCEREQIESWYLQHGDDANWMLDARSSGVIALEIDHSFTRGSLTALTRDDDSWRRSLHFDASGKTQYLFQSQANLPSLRNYPGLRLLAGDSILIPPSRSTTDTEFVYVNPDAPLLSADWLREAVRRGTIAY
jgi:hypothetical protein